MPCCQSTIEGSEKPSDAPPSGRKDVEEASDGEDESRKVCESMCHPRERLSLAGMTSKATRMLMHLTDGLPSDNIKATNEKVPDKGIPKHILKNAKGVMFFTVVRTGFLFGARGGTGILVVKKADGSWTPPAAYGVGGLAFGCVWGGSVTDVLLILNSDAQVKAFRSNAQVQLGADLEVTVGPWGRDAAVMAGASDKGVTAAYSYSSSQGLYVGASVDPAVLLARNSENKAYYGIDDVTTEDLLDGKVLAPADKLEVAELHNLLKKVQG